MSRFNLADYETVHERIQRFYTDHPDGRIHTDLLHVLEDAQGWRWVVRASVYTGDICVATGLAEERLNGQGANKDAALENSETSAIGRALANWKYSGDKRASREEMGKAGRYAKPTTPAPEIPQEYRDTIDAATTTEQLVTIGTGIPDGEPWTEAAKAYARQRWEQINAAGRANFDMEVGRR